MARDTNIPTVRGIGLALVLVMFLTACGVEIGNPKRPTTDPTTDKVGVIAADLGLLNEVITGVLDETFPVVATNFSSSESLALLLTGEDPIMDTTTTEVTSKNLRPQSVSRSCSPTEAGGVLVSWAHRGAIEKSAKGRKNTVQIQGMNDETRGAVYSDPDVTLSCNAAATHAKVSILRHARLAVAMTGDKQRTLLVKVGDTVKRDFSTKVHMKAGCDYARQPDEGDVRVVRRGLMQDIERFTTLTTAGSGKITLASHIVTDDKAPLVIYEKYAADETLIEKRLASGTVNVTSPDDARIELTYDEIVFSANDACTPQSGSISGKVFAEATDEAPLKTYTITFDGSNEALINFDSGEPAFIEWDACSDGML